MVRQDRSAPRMVCGPSRDPGWSGSRRVACERGPLRRQGHRQPLVLRLGCAVFHGCAANRASASCPHEGPWRHGRVQSRGHGRRTLHCHADIRRLGLDYRSERCCLRLRLSVGAPCRSARAEGGALWLDHQPGSLENPGPAPARGLQLEPDQYGMAGQRRSGHRPRSQRRLHGISVVVRNRDVLRASAYGDRRLRAGQADAALAAQPVGQGERQRPDRARDHARRGGVESRKYAGDRAVRPDGRQGIRMDGRSGVRERDVSRNEERVSIGCWARWIRTRTCSRKGTESWRFTA